MQKAHKDLLRSLMSNLRHTLQGTGMLLDTPNGDGLRGDLDRELERIGIGRSGVITPLDALPNPTPHDVRAHRTAEVQLANLPNSVRPAARAEIVERAAYTWINRLLALRTMEARGLIEETLRANPAYEGISEALYLLRYEAPQRTAGADGGWWAVVEDACQAQAQILPGLFDLNDPNAALRPSTAALLRCLQTVGRPELDIVFVDPDVISWSYQFYQEEAKARIDAKVKTGGKVETRSELAAKTQLFTEPYMVKWLLQNSLGRSYHETYPNSALPQTWEYYIDRDQILANDNVEDPSPNRPNAQPRFSLSELTFMDPCTGSGHFQREAFDLLFAMYREQHPAMDARVIADRILTHHLHGIDIDPRAVQLAAVTLVLRAWETVGRPYTPPTLNLATTPSHLDAGALDRHLQRHPEDAVYRPILQGVFAALGQAPILGSLLKPEEHLDAALQEFRKQNRGGQTGLLGEDEETNRLLAELARHDPGELKKLLMERTARSFAREAKESDVAARLLGSEAGEGLHLLQLLDRKYAVVATNPPYMGSKNMDGLLKKYVEKHYNAGKRDLYAAFILRCLDLILSAGRVAMVTQQSWMFLKSFTVLRAMPEDSLRPIRQKTRFTGLLREACVEAVAHLGPNAFEEISGEVVQSAMFVTSRRVSSPNSRLLAYRLVGIENAAEKANALQRQDPHFTIEHRDLLVLPGSPFGYWLDENFLKVVNSDGNVRAGAKTRSGLTTGNSPRFYRKHWEISYNKIDWLPLANGGSYRKWYGNNFDYLRWGSGWENILSDLGNRLPSREYYGLEGVVLSQSARGCLSCRISSGVGFTNSSIAVFPQSPYSKHDLAASFNNRCASYLVRVYAQKMGIESKHLDALALIHTPEVRKLASFCYKLKKLIVDLEECLEYGFTPSAVSIASSSALSAILHSAEGQIETIVMNQLNVHASQAEIVATTGTPAGWYPIVAIYDQLPELSSNHPTVPQEVVEYVKNHDRIYPCKEELLRLKVNLQKLYESGPGVKIDALDLEDLDHHDDEVEEEVSGAYIPIPTETFLEELSIKLQIHPISVYWLLEELRADGVHCKPEEKRLLEDRLSVIVLRLLGHRWPKQIEAGEPVPAWADRDGVIPLTAGTGESTLADLVRARLRAEDGDLGAQQAEALLYELTGSSLEEWLRGDFFRRHTSQFKRRPIAWHLASSPVAGGRKRTATPAFECIVYYHATGANASLPGRGGDILARIRMQYVDRLLAPAQRDLAQARRDGDETTAARANALILELEDFARRLRQVEEGGFACQALEEVIANEPLDRWAGDGVFAPAGRAEFLAQEEAWQVDINDGVRVNIAPLQEAGLLASDVLARADVTKAIADRARWRADERRWVRQGKLPRCGWMDETVPESPQWTALASEREKERQRLEERRQKVLEELQS